MTEEIVQLLIAERDKLDRAIQALGGITEKRRGRPPGSTNKKSAQPATVLSNATDWVKASVKTAAPVKRKMSAAGRKKIADAARKRWALIKAGKAPSPFAKGGKKK